MGLLLLLVLFFGVSILELQVFVWVQDLLSFPVTLLILVLDSIFGAWLVRVEGARAWRRFTEAISGGEAPTTEVIDGALVLFGGALLLTPGFVTDVIGLLFVLGPTRTIFNSLVRRRVASRAMGSLFGLGGRRHRGPDVVEADPAPHEAPPKRSTPPPAGVIDVEVIDVHRNPRNTGGDGG